MFYLALSLVQTKPWRTDQKKQNLPSYETAKGSTSQNNFRLDNEDTESSRDLH